MSDAKTVLILFSFFFFEIEWLGVTRYILNEIIMVYNRLSLKFMFAGNLLDQLAIKRDIGSDLFLSKII